MKDFNRKEAAAYLGIAPATLAAYACDRTGPAYRRTRGDKGHTFYTLADLDAWKSPPVIETHYTPQLVKELEATHKRIEADLKVLAKLIKQLAREVQS